MKRKFKIVLLLIGMACILLVPNKSKAVLQANGGTPAKYDANNWVTGIRQMQAIGGALGLTDTINGTNLTSGNKNLDIHMEKNTEYGALALLSASAYGTGSTPIKDGGSTTGNKTGVVMKMSQANAERVSAALGSTDATSIKNANGRYKNIYTTDITVAKAGDAIENWNWHGGSSGAGAWLQNNTGVVLRGYSGSIFSCYGIREWKFGGCRY